MFCLTSNNDRHNNVSSVLVLVRTYVQYVYAEYSILETRSCCQKKRKEKVRSYNTDLSQEEEGQQQQSNWCSNHYFTSIVICY